MQQKIEDYKNFKVKQKPWNTQKLEHLKSFSYTVLLYEVHNCCIDSLEFLLSVVTNVVLQ